MSAGDGTGAAIIVSPDGSERRVNIGDEIEVAHKSVPAQGDAVPPHGWRPASEAEPGGDSSFAATERSCVKCGSDDIAVSWHAAGADHPSRAYAECRTYGADHGLPKEEHLCCTCRVCQYRWKEDVLDASFA